ncbi:MAG TPA: glycosyltransferase family 4 protein, partial [Pyrinomonadaceae bacterium]|nr:glycosyltransferase family 4 protein [Pyrinomonadaceae bacterium]
MAPAIDIFVPDAFPDTNSVGRATSMMAKGLLASGEFVRVTARWKSAEFGWEPPTDIPTLTCGVYDRRQKKEMTRWLWMKSAALFAVACWMRIVSSNAKCTIFYGASPLYLPAAITARLLGRKIAFAQYDLYRPTAADSRVKQRAAAIYARIERFLARSSRLLVVSESQLLIDHFSALAPGISVFPNWPPTDSRFFAGGSRKRGRDLASVANDAEMIVYTGAINRLEGVDFLIRAMKEVVAARPSAQLVLAGAVIGDIVEGAAPDYHNMPRDLGIERNVKFLGTVSKEDVRDLLAASDCLAMPKRDHPGNEAASPIKLGEYLASGRPVVASRVCGIERWLQDRQSIMLCAPGGIHDLA